MNHDDLAGLFAQNESIFERRVASANYQDFLVLDLIACMYTGFQNAVAVKLFLSGHFQLSPAHPGRNDNSRRGITTAVRLIQWFFC